MTFALYFAPCLLVLGLLLAGKYPGEAWILRRHSRPAESARPMTVRRSRVTAALAALVQRRSV